MNPLKKPSFAGGELSPALWARTDINRYAIGLRTLRNFIISKQGGAVSRPGTEYVGEVKNSASGVTLIPFVATDGDAYILEFGHLYIRVWKDGSVVTVTATVWDSATVYDHGDIVSHNGVNYYAVRFFGEFGMIENKNKMPPSEFWHPLTGSILEIPTPYTAAHIPDIRTEQIGDTLVIVHASHKPRILTRITNTKWTFAEVRFMPRIPPPFLVFST